MFTTVHLLRWRPCGYATGVPQIRCCGRKRTAGSTGAAFQASYFDVGLPRRLRDAIAGATGQHELAGRLQIDPVPEADKKRSGVIARAQDDPDLLALIHQGREVSRAGTRLVESSDQAALGDPDARHAEGDRHVGGQSAPPRVGVALAVEANGAPFMRELP